MRAGGRILIRGGKTRKKLDERVETIRYDVVALYPWLTLKFMVREIHGATVLSIETQEGTEKEQAIALRIYSFKDALKLQTLVNISYLLIIC